MLDASSPLSLYFQLKEALIQKIVKKEWVSNSKIPTEMELCEQFNVSRITVRKALGEMEQEGYIFRRKGVGTFVNKSKIDQKVSRFYSFSEELKKMGHVHKTAVLEFDLQSGSKDVCHNLELNEKELVIVVKRLRMVDNSPYTLETSYLPYKLLPHLTKDMINQNGLYNSMREMGVYPDKATETIGALVLEEEDAKLLETQSGSAALSVIRRTNSKNARVEYCISIVRGDKFTFTIDLL